MLELITDRTQADVDRAKSLRSKGWVAMTPEEQAEWLAGVKGAYNASDLNRVSDAMEYLVDTLNGYGYSVPGYVKGPVWYVEDIPTKEQMERYRQNVVAIRAVLEVLKTTPQPPDTMAGLTFTGANSIEQILVDVEVLIESMSRVFLHAGIPWAYAGTGFYFDGGA